MVEKKKILICSHWLEIGGAERALIGLLFALDYDKYDVELYLCRHSGEFLKWIPNEVKLLPEDSKAAAIAKPIRTVLREGNFDIAVGRTIGKIFSAIYSHCHPSDMSCVGIEYSNRFTYPFAKPIGRGAVYDLMISFLEPHYIAAHKASARKCVAWMHTDYSAVQVDRKAGLRIWNMYDTIAAISEDCKKSFVSVFSELEEKIVLIENILPASLVLDQAEAFDAGFEMPDDGCVKLLSIGRFCSAKNFDNVPDICARLIKLGLDVKWYLIGFGGDEDLIRRKIQEAGMEERVIILGKKENPYPYIKACDLYVQPSRYEGKAVTVREAQMLGKPVVITNYATSASQLEDSVDGVIVPMDNEGCAAGIAALLQDIEQMERLIENCKQRDYSNSAEVEKLCRLIEE